MADDTPTGSIPTADPTVRVYRTEDGITATTVITRHDYKAYRAMGWTRDDPAFVPDADIVKLAHDNDGLVPMHTNLGGTPKAVEPDAVAWHQQNGFTINT